MPGLHRPNNVVSHEMSTDNRGVILDTMRGTLVGNHRAGPIGKAAANAFEEPEDIVFGSNGDVGGNDPDNCYDYLDGH